MDRIQLPYTLETCVGMVRNSGLPASNRGFRAQASQNTLDRNAVQALDKHPVVTLPSVEAIYTHNSLREKLRRLGLGETWRIASFGDFLETDWFDDRHTPIPETAIACLRANRSPNRKLIHGSDADKNRFIANVLACRDTQTDIHRLITYIKNRMRLNLEQAAAAVVSSFVNHDRLSDAAVLVRELTAVLATSHMGGGRETCVARNTLAQGRAEALAHAAATAQRLCSKAVARRGELDTDAPRNYREFVLLLLRVRSVRPTTCDRCLYIPRWLFEEAGIEPTGGHAAYLDDYQVELKRIGQEEDVLRGYKWPENPATADSIVLSKHFFRVLQRIVFQMYRFLDPVVRLRVRVREMEDRVLYSTAWIDRQLRETDDVARVAFWFFAYQRRLQLKVVSDDKWTRFLNKGEGQLLYQNSLTLTSTFEEALARIAGLKLKSLTTVGREDTLDLIDETCLLMKEYVDVYGKGEKENLVFRQGVAGGKGRGEVDKYNMLCVILRDLKARAKEEGIADLPGPVYKFLAKDIMQWNNGWGDDAFASGRVHGWEEWVVKRGLV